MTPGEASHALAQGREAFREKKWPEALGHFIQAVGEDPTSEGAHAYMRLALRELRLQQAHLQRTERMELLEAASQQASLSEHQAQQLQDAFIATRSAEQRRRQEGWQIACEEARLEMRGGRTLRAFYRALRVLSEEPSHDEARRLVGELQSVTHDQLRRPGAVTMEERYALSGFDAYSDADYSKALLDWEKAARVSGRTLPEVEPFRQVALLEVEQGQQRLRLKALFAKATDLFTRRKYFESLALFRQLAVLDPEYPQLAHALAQAEAAAERERTGRQSEERKTRIGDLFKQAVFELERNRYPEAQIHLQALLELDPTHPQALSYMGLVQAELRRRHDPKAAQHHYEVGLVAYASGKLEEAVREWRATLKLDPGHEKARNALAKTQKELALNRDLP